MKTLIVRNSIANGSFVADDARRDGDDDEIREAFGEEAAEDLPASFHHQ